MTENTPNYQGLSDEETLKYYKEGNESARYELYDRHRENGISYMTKLCNKDYLKAANLFNDTFDSVLNALKKRECTNFNYYLYGALKKNFGHDWGKRKKSNKPMVFENLDNYLDKILNKDDNIEQVIIKKERFNQLLNWLKKELSPLQHSSIMLRADGYSYDDIAIELEVSSDSVRGLLYRAKSKIKEFQF